MIKRVKSFIILISFVLMIQSAVSAEPSDWAVELVESSIEDNLAPFELQSDYQNTIKRCEYVLLALNVLEQNNIDILIENNSPFTDIEGHKYEREIIMAYNANLIGGYDDKTFRPDNNIKREEIAALIYNLVSKINPASKFPVIDSEYADQNKISNWALPFVEFCYKNKIISGRGKINGLDEIDPIGNATREESIILLYKVSINERLLANYRFDDLVIKSYGVKEIRTSDDINMAAQKIGYEPIITAIGLSYKENTDFTLFEENYFTLETKEVGKITIVDSKYQNEIVLQVKDLSEAVILNDYIKLLNDLYPGNLMEEVLFDIIDSLKMDGEYILFEDLNDDGMVSASSNIFEEERWYFIQYKRDK